MNIEDRRNEHATMAIGLVPFGTVFQDEDDNFKMVVNVTTDATDRGVYCVDIMTGRTSKFPSDLEVVPLLAKVVVYGYMNITGE